MNLSGHVSYKAKATLENDAWNIHDIFRIWIQGAIGQTVSRLTRLFHIPRTGRGRELRIRKASCLMLSLSLFFVL